jgi:hypothetical protein
MYSGVNADFLRLFTHQLASIPLLVDSDKDHYQIDKLSECWYVLCYPTGNESRRRCSVVTSGRRCLCRAWWRFHNQRWRGYSWRECRSVVTFGQNVAKRSLAKIRPRVHSIRAVSLKSQRLIQPPHYTFIIEILNNYNPYRKGYAFNSFFIKSLRPSISLLSELMADITSLQYCRRIKSSVITKAWI